MLSPLRALAPLHQRCEGGPALLHALVCVVHPGARLEGGLQLPCWVAPLNCDGFRNREPAQQRPPRLVPGRIDQNAVGVFMHNFCNYVRKEIEGAIDEAEQGFTCLTFS